LGRGVKRLSEMRLAAKWGEQLWLTDAGSATPRTKTEQSFLPDSLQSTKYGGPDGQDISL
jgi:hypothetical protein